MFVRGAPGCLLRVLGRHGRLRQTQAVRQAGAKPSQQAKFEELLLKEGRRWPSALGTPNPVRKRRPVTSFYKQPRAETVDSIAIAESLNLHTLAADSAVSNLYVATFIDEEFDDALHLVKWPAYQIDPSSLSEAYVFADGVVVFWNFEIGARAQLLRDLERHSTGIYESSVAHSELDSMPFTLVGEKESCIRKDCFVLEKAKHGDGRHSSHEALLQRFAFSHAFAASVKVGVWESLLESEAGPLAETTKKLKNGIIPWKRQEALRRAGQFADLRHSINLGSTLLSRDVYWERDHLETFYKMTARHLTLDRRLILLNNRLDYCEELVKMVDNMIALRHASTLEWMIIILIVIEVIFDTLHFIKSSDAQKVVIVQEDLSNGQPQISD